MKTSKHPFVDALVMVDPKFMDVVKEFRAPIRKVPLANRLQVIMALCEILGEEAEIAREEAKTVDEFFDMVDDYVKKILGTSDN